MYPRILSRCFNWAKSHGSCGVEFEKEADNVRVFLRIWDVDTFRGVSVASLHRYSSDLHQEVTALGRVVDALGPDVSVGSISGGSTVLVEAFCEYLGNGYRQKLPSFRSSLLSTVSTANSFQCVRQLGRARNDRIHRESAERC